MTDALEDALRRTLRARDLDAGADRDVDSVLAAVHAARPGGARKPLAAIAASVLLVAGLALGSAELRGGRQPVPPASGTPVDSSPVSGSPSPSTDVPDSNGNVFFGPDGHTRLQPGDSGYPRNATPHPSLSTGSAR